MNRTRRDVLEYILRHPGCTASDVGVGVDVPPSTAQAHLKSLRQVELIVPAHDAYNKPIRYMVRADTVGKLLELETDARPAIRLGVHCAERFAPDTHDEFRHEISPNLVDGA